MVPARLGVAVSGGGDSTALLVLADDWARPRGVLLHAVTVDHGLRPGAATEAAAVSLVCATRGIAHDRLCWRGWDGRGNLQAAARRARYRLIADWALARGIADVALGHSRDDQAETVLLRLARGSGVDGLSGMAPARRTEGVRWLRPVLACRRAALREVLRRGGIGWSEDPSNDDERFQRVTARGVLAALEPLGLGVEGLVATAGRMAQARAALERTARGAARRHLRVEAGDVLIDLPGFLGESRDIRERLLAHALCWVASAEYRPRHAALAALLGRVAAGDGGTLHGCLVLRGTDHLRIGREPAAVAGLRGRSEDLWDNRWRLSGPATGDMGGDPVEIGALGPDGLRRCGDWRATGLPRSTLLASPAVWRGTRLIAAPLAEKGGEWRAETVPGPERLHSMTLSD